METIQIDHEKSSETAAMPFKEAVAAKASYASKNPSPRLMHSSMRGIVAKFLCFPYFSAFNSVNSFSRMNVASSSAP